MATIEVQELAEEEQMDTEQQQQETTETNNTDTDEQVEEKVEETTESNNEDESVSEEDAKDPAPKENEEEADESKALEETLKSTKESVDEATKTLADKGIDYNALTQEYEEKGALSDDTYKKLADAGYPKAVVDTYIRGVAAVNEAFTDAVYSAAGGKAEYSKLSKYIESKGQDAIDGFNDAVMNGSLSTVKMLIAGFKAEMTLRNGTQKASVLGGNSGVTSGFANEAAMEKAMDDPRYGVDEEYTKTVTKRLSKSKFFSFGR
jgi:hypothetical protein